VLARHAAAFAANDVQIAVVVAQRADAVRRYIEETGLPFDILTDERRDTLRAYGVWHRIGIDAWNIARPAVFLINRDASIAWAFVSTHQRDFPDEDTLTRIVTTRDSDPGQK
jgi:peroxiredoxin